MYHPNEIRLLLKKRKGFIKIALQTGRELIPAFSFGENFLFPQWTFTEGSLIWRWQKFMQKITGMTVPFACGRGIFQV